MSVTFSVAKQTTTAVASQCPECAGKGCGAVWCDNGVTQDFISDCAELNLANGNATALLYQVFPEAFTAWYEPALEGEWSIEYLPEIAARVIRIMNTKQGSNLICDTVEHSNPGQARLIEMGRSKEQVARYYTALLAVIKDAQRLESSVIWG